MLVMFFFRHAFSEFPRPIALKLCHLIGVCVYLIMQAQKLGGQSPKKIRGPKTCKISVDFGPLRTLIANIAGTAEDIQNRPTLQNYGVSTFTPRSIPISNAMFTRSLLAACYWPPG